MSIEAEQRPCCGCAYGVLATCLVMPHAPCPHPYPTLARYRWVLVPACCLLHGCITGDVPLLSSGEANFKYHKHNSTQKGPLPASTSAPRECAAGGSGQLARGTAMWGRAPLSGDPHSLTRHYFYLLTTLAILTYLLTGTTTRWASIIGRSTRSITSLPTRCPLTRVS